MLHYIDDEEDVFWCLFKIMLKLDWRLFYCEGMQRAHDAQTSVTMILEMKFSDIFGILDPSTTFAICQSISINLIMSIYTVKVPLEISKRIFEYWLYRNDGEECLFDLLEILLIRTRAKMLKMDEDELYRYLIDHQFVVDCFNECKGTPDWLEIWAYRSYTS